MDNQISQHKRMAMGKGLSERPREGGRFAKGGSTGELKTGIPTTPITDAKRANGIPGFKKGGSAK